MGEEGVEPRALNKSSYGSNQGNLAELDTCFPAVSELFVCDVMSLCNIVWCGHDSPVGAVTSVNRAVT